MATYRVHFNGYADIIADSEEEAREKYSSEDFIQSESNIDEVEYLSDEEVFAVDYRDIFIN